MAKVSAKALQNPILKERQHLLIIGAPRSGTTLLASIVGRHSEIALLNEDKGWAMRRVISKKVVGNKRCVPNQIELKKNGFFTIRLFKKLGLVKEYPSSEYSIEDYLQLPNIKIIALIRNGNDVVSSVMQRGRKNFKIASHRWCRAIEVIHELKTRHPDTVLVVSFEQLILDPASHAKRMVSFLGLDFQPEMLEGYKYNWYYPNETNLNPEKVNRHKRESINFDLEKRFPAVCRKYEELLGHAG